MFTLPLNTEEIKILQLLLEAYCADPYNGRCEIERRLLERITILQLNPPEDHGHPSFSNVPVF